MIIAISREIDNKISSHLAKSDYPETMWLSCTGSSADLAFKMVVTLIHPRPALNHSVR